MRIKVLTEALQLQLEPQVVKLERSSSRLGVRARSFGGLGSNWMMGISVANEGARSRALVEEDLDLSANSRTPRIISEIIPGACALAALMESVQSASRVEGEDDSGEFKISILGRVHLLISCSRERAYEDKDKQIRERKDCFKITTDQGYMLQREREGVEEDNLRLLVVDCE